jgi:hypothetical protein
LVTEPISFVTWKWHTKDSPRSFAAKHVNIVRAMIARNYPREFRFICITDDPKGLDERIETMPMPVRFDHIRSPQGTRFPNCYCRLWNFSREASVLGERIFQLDIDVVITGDLQPLVDRSEDFVGWCDKRFVWNKIAGGAYLLRTGSMPQIWEDFDPLTSPAQAFAAGNGGSDQGWMSFKMYPSPRFTEGLVKINWTPSRTREIPKGARMVFTNGVQPPWSHETRRRYPWLKEHWKL